MLKGFPGQRGIGKALDAVADYGKINELKLSAISQRRKMLLLGHDQKIRLHYGAMMSCVEILTTLYQYWMTISPDDPGRMDRDRFILSKGHAAPALYVILSMIGFFPESEFRVFRKLGSRLQGHPDRNKTPGIDCSTGSLGQGFPVGCGMALGAKMDQAPFRVYCVASDGECNEGSVWEAALIGGNLGLDNLVVLLDWNGKSSYGEMKGRNDIEPLADKWLSFGWNVEECDGHDFVSITGGLSRAELTKGKPSVLLCRTIKGKGIPWAEKNRAKSNFFLEDEFHREALEQLDIQERALHGK